MAGRGVFICYRHGDVPGWTFTLRRDLRRRLRQLDGNDEREIFLDRESITPGADWRSTIESTLARCSTVVVVIGPRWLESAGPDEQPRIRDPADVLAGEIAAALESGALVVPALFEGAAMPSAEDLPERLVALRDRQTIEVRVAGYDGYVDDIARAVIAADRPAFGAPGPEPPAVESAVQRPTIDTTATTSSEPARLARRTGARRAGTVEVARRPDTSRDRPGVRAVVVHGGIVTARHPVLVGHHAGTALSGAEALIDRHYDGHLSERVELGGYPAALDTSQHFRAPAWCEPRAGALVVGLGEYGALGPLQLIETVRAALVDHALDAALVEEGSALRISSSLLACEGPLGLRIDQAVRALLEAVQAANLVLAPRGATYDEIELLDPDGARAEAAFRCVEAMALDSTVVSDVGLRRGTGAVGLSPPPDSGPRAVVIRVTDASATGLAPAVTAHPELDLEFTFDGRTVRRRVGRELLDGLLGDNVARSRPSPELNTTLSRLLLPEEVQWDVMGAASVELRVDSSTAHIPWEMLADRPASDHVGLALRADLIRRTTTEDVGRVRRSSLDRALVVGDPTHGDAGSAVPGAREECRAVSQTLSRWGYDVDERCGSDAPSGVASDVETALLTTEYRIVHVAAQGAVDPHDPSRAGIVVGPDRFLDVDVFSQLRVVPDLVFINCGHRGPLAGGTAATPATELHRFGARAALQLTDVGVRAVVVAAWAVDDAASVAFARALYAELLLGSTFAESVLEARGAARRATPDACTWGAFQCYGEAAYRLTWSEAPREVPLPPVTEREVLRRVELVLSQVATTRHPEKDRSILAELEVLEDGVESANWLTGPDAGRLCEELGRARAAIGDPGGAAGWLERGLSTGDGSMSLGGLEVLVGAWDRYAILLNRSGRGDVDRSEIDRLMASSSRLLDLLDRLIQDGRSHLMRGAHHVRQSVVLVGDRRITAMANAADRFWRAYGEGMRSALLQHVVLSDMARRSSGDTSIEQHDEDLPAVLGEIRAAAADSDDFWALDLAAYGRLVEALVAGTVAVDELIDAWARAFSARSTPEQRRAPLDHLLDLADLEPDERRAAALFALHDALSELA